MSRIWHVAGQGPVGGEDQLLTAAGRALIDDVDAAAQRVTLGLGTAAVDNVPVTGNADTDEVVLGSDTRLADNRNAADVSPWAKGATKPVYTSSEIANISAAGQALIDGANAAAQLTTLGVTAAAKTVLDDTTVAAMLATLGGVAITPPNLITNGDFEVNTMGWNGSGSTLSRETDAPLVGAGSMKVLNVIDSWCMQNVSGLIVGHVYLFKGLCKSTAAAGRKVVPYKTNTPGTAVDCSVSPTVVTLIFTATATTDSLRFRLDGNVAGEYYLVDSVVRYDLTAWNPVPLQAQLDAITARLTAHGI